MYYISYPLLSLCIGRHVKQENVFIKKKQKHIQTNCLNDIQYFFVTLNYSDFLVV